MYQKVYPVSEIELENNILKNKLRAIHQGNAKLTNYSKEKVNGNETLKYTKEKWFLDKEKKEELVQKNVRLANKIRTL